METSTLDSKTAGPGAFERLGEELRRLIAGQQLSQAQTRAEDFLQTCENKAQFYLLKGVIKYLQQDFLGAVELLLQAAAFMGNDQSPGYTSLFSGMLINAQLLLPRRSQPAAVKGHHFYKANIAELRAIDPELAGEVQSASWPGAYILIQYWNGLHLFFQEKRVLMAMDEKMKRDLQDHLEKINPIMFIGVNSGQKIRYCLDHPYEGIHGMCRSHYLVERDPEMLRVLLCLDDFSRALRREELIIFGGSTYLKHLREKFATLRYTPPQITLGQLDRKDQYINLINNEIRSRDTSEQVKKYYQSSEFRRRQRRIAAGELLPRIFIHTGRWTTFLKYCAADFRNAFSRLGCETSYLIEESDTQSILPVLHWKYLDEFRPDAVFMVSHARPSAPFVPEQLPFIGYIQDKCGPLIEIADMTGRFIPQDLFICLCPEHQRWLEGKKVPRGQTCILPVPSDEAMFFPLGNDHPRAAEFTIDTSFVKHGSPDVELVFQKFLAELGRVIPEERLRERLQRLFQELYRISVTDSQRCFYEPELEEIALSFISSSARDDLRHFVKQSVGNFFCMVSSAAWRYRFLEALDRAGFPPALYGLDWDQHRSLAHLARGPVDRETVLNLVYNFTRINISINHASTMTTRLVECGLAGGFIMAADHDPENDYLHARDYYEEDREIVFFHSCDDLIDRCRYYLAHPEQRREIAEAMRERSLRERTVMAAAESVLMQWRHLLNQNPTL